MVNSNTENTSEEEFNKQIANKFNMICLKYDQQSTQSIGLKRITSSDVHHHFHQVRHLPNGETFLINQEIRYLIDCLDQIKKDRMWCKTGNNNIFLNQQGMREYKEFLTLLGSLILIRKRCDIMNKQIKNDKQQRQMINLNSNLSSFKKQRSERCFPIR